MATQVFTGVAERADDGYSVYFPDVPGCTSAGKSLFEAFANGERALAFHFKGLVEEGDDLPRPSTEVRVGDDVEAVTFFLARADLPGKAVRLNITMDEGLVASIDRIARNRSEFLAEAARYRLRELADA